MEIKKLTISIEEAAKALGISRNLGYRLAATNELPGVLHLGQKRMMISKAIFDQYLQGTYNNGENSNN
jgi:excisionase family DNA binding protein